MKDHDLPFRPRFRLSFPCLPFLVGAVGYLYRVSVILRAPDVEPRIAE
jgi:hypothetical protein